MLFTVLLAIICTGLPAWPGDRFCLYGQRRTLGAALAPLLVYAVITLISLRIVYLASAGMFALGLGVVGMAHRLFTW